jgi:hypothetical protein
VSQGDIFDRHALQFNRVVQPAPAGPDFRFARKHQPPVRSSVGARGQLGWTIPTRRTLTRTQRRWGIGLASTAIAGGCLYVGSRVRDDAFWSSVLVNVGTAFLLAIPAVLLERLFDRRLTEAKESIDAVDRRLDGVDTTVGNVSSRLDELRQEVVDVVEVDRKDEVDTAVGPANAVRSDASFETVHRGLVHARDTHATTARVVVPVPDEGLSIRFEVLPNEPDRTVLVTVVPDNRNAPARTTAGMRRSRLRICSETWMRNSDRSTAQVLRRSSKTHCQPSSPRWPERSRSHSSGASTSEARMIENLR